MTNLNGSFCLFWLSGILIRSFFKDVTHLERGNSHLGSDGSSSSETLGSIGPSLDDRRAILTNGVFEFMEELESKDTCLSEEAEQNVIVSVRVADRWTAWKIQKERACRNKLGYKKAGRDKERKRSLWWVRTREELVSLWAVRDRNMVTVRVLQPMRTAQRKGQTAAAS